MMIYYCTTFCAGLQCFLKKSRKNLFKRGFLWYNRGMTRGKGENHLKNLTPRMRFVAFHGIIVLLLCLIPLYRWIYDSLPDWLVGCFLHDRLFLYCPVCGGTRAVLALLRLDVVAALRYNAYVTLLCVLFVVGDAWAWIRFFQKKEPTVRVGGRVWIALSVLLVGYFLVRNYLMVAHGIDPTGDLVAFWNVLLRS